MSHTTETTGSDGLTNTEKKLLINLLKHPKIKDMAQEMIDNEKADE
jgi:hypothetical protein